MSVQRSAEVDRPLDEDHRELRVDVLDAQPIAGDRDDHSDNHRTDDH